MPGLFSGPIFGNGGIFGGGANGAEDPQNDARMAMMAQLLQGGGYSPQRSSFGQIMGQALMAGQTARKQSMQMQQAREAADLDKRYREAQIQNMGREQDPSSVREYEYAKNNGYKGTFQEWTTAGGQTSRPSSVQEWDFFSKLDANQQQRYLEMKRNPNFTVKDVNQAPTAIQQLPGGNVRTTPLSTTASEASAAGQVKGAEAQAGAVGTAVGNIAGGIQTKGSNATIVKSLIDDARTLLESEDTTGSTLGNAADSLAATVGYSTAGAKNTGKLRVIQAGLMMNSPRMEGPQGEKDVELYKQAAAQIGDPTVPAETRAAAIDTIEAIQDRYQERAASAAPAGVVPPAGSRSKETAAQRAKRLGL